MAEESICLRTIEESDRASLSKAQRLGVSFSATKPTTLRLNVKLNTTNYSLASTMFVQFGSFTNIVLRPQLHYINLVTVTNYNVKYITLNKL